MAETILAYFLFDRADDNAAFLSAAASGIDDSGVLSATTVKLVYLIATPARLLGNQELLHILWFRAIALFGFLAAFEWVNKVVSFDQAVSSSDVNRARLTYMTFILLYPGIIAWTASLLRDGIAIALFFFSAYAWTSRRKLLAMVLMPAALLLRPQLALLLIIFALALIYNRIFRHARRPWLLLASLCVVISLLGFNYRTELSELFNPAFGEFQSYPTIESYFDIAGYLKVLIQALADPVSIASLGGARAFGLLEACFFVVILLLGSAVMTSRNRRLRLLMISTLLTLWAFAYFEVYVSGFSRHRIGAVVVLIACIAVSSRLSRGFRTTARQTPE